MDGRRFAVSLSQVYVWIDNLSILSRPAVFAGLKVLTVASPPPTPHGAPRVIICDYNSLLQSVTGLLRMSGYAVFQAYDGQAAEELCTYIPDVDLLVLNTEGTGVDTPDLVRRTRIAHPGLQVLHIGKAPIPGMPDDVLNLSEQFTIAQLVLAVDELLQAGRT